MKSLVRIFVYFLLLFNSYQVFSKSPHSFYPDSIPNYLQKQIQLFPQEKIYAQLDKADYIAGEDIWFRIYLVNAATHQPLPISQYVYVELMNMSEGIKERVKIKSEDGIFRGYLTLPEELKADTYHLRFYTQYMNELGEDFFFTRPIQVGTLATVQKGEKKKTQKIKLDYDVDFFPEGGPLPIGNTSHIAFKAINQDGLGEDIVGFVLNSKADTITHFSSQYRGMGEFIIHIESEDDYYAVCRNKTGLEKRFQLPKAEENVLALSLNWLKNNLIVSVNQNLPSGSEKSYYLVGLCRGLLFYLDQWDLSKDFVSIPEDFLPSGILQWVLIDENHNPVSERLVFHLAKDDITQISFSTDKTIYEAKEKISSTLIFMDSQNKLVNGNFSVSITDDTDVIPDSCITVLSTLLLSSDLKGNIEDPNYYFRNNHPATRQHLDLLMRTQGWSRYRISDVLKGEYQLPSKSFEISQSVSGTVIGGAWMNKPASNYPVSLLSIQHMFFQETKTDANGRFNFENLDFPDSCNFVIQSTTPKGNIRTIVMPDPDFIVPSENILLSIHIPDSIGFMTYLNKADNQLLLTKGIRTIHLSDVVVRAPKINSGKSIFSTGMGKRYDHKKIKESTYTDLYTFLMTIPGIRVSGGGIQKITSTRSGAEPLFFLNDVRMEMDFLETVQIGDIEELEFVIGGAGAILGKEGMERGALLITLKDGGYEDDNKEYFHIKTITPLGYQVTKEFYSPTYEPEKKENEILPDLRTTLYWNPAIFIRDGKAEFDFYTGEKFSSYSVVIEGITNDGRLIHTIEKIKGTKQEDE